MRKQLKQIRSDWFSCDKCELHTNRKRTVSHRYVGRPQTGDMFLVGEAPGADENRQGKPFVGRSGQLLDKLLAEAGVKSATIINLVACKPPLNRNPKSEELARCNPRLLQIVYATKPKALVIVGKVARERFLPAKAGNGVVYRIRVGSFDVDTVAVFHPAYLLRRSKDREAYQDTVRGILIAEDLINNHIPF